jgi:hypothetical protein
MTKDFRNLVYQGNEINDVKKREALLDEVEELTAELKRWKDIAGDLYDELSVRGLNGGYADCIFRHSLSGSDTKDCLLAYEDASGQPRDED